MDRQRGLHLSYVVHGIFIFIYFLLYFKHVDDAIFIIIIFRFIYN